MAVANRHKLVGTKIYIKYDSSPEERKVRKELLVHKTALTELGKTCKLKKNTLIVDSVPFTLQQLKAGGPADAQTADKTQNKRMLSVSPVTPETLKKPKKISTPARNIIRKGKLNFQTQSNLGNKTDMNESNSDMEYQTDEDEFKGNDNTKNHQKNGDAPPTQGGSK
ncbi:hypothetical protein M8J75_005146 [Diaphorina citri]|nr:hypothetical protein M8J75_005146 [Diaphorina citri]